MNCKLIMFTQFPPPIHGLSIVNETYYLFFKEKYDVYKINISGISIFSFWGKLVKVIRMRILDGYNILFYSPAASRAGLARDIILIFIGKVFGYKVFCTVHRGNLYQELEKVFGNYIIKLLVFFTDKFIFLNEEHLKGIDKFINKKFTIIDNPIYPDRLVNSELVSQKIKNIKYKNKVTFLFLGNMIKSKGYFFFAEALAKIKNNLNWDAYFVGKWLSENDRKEIVEFFSKVGISDRCIIKGPIYETNNLKEIMVHSDVLVFPTYYPQEARPMVIIEAFAFGIPVISTYHTSIPKMVTHGLNGFLIKNKNQVVKELTDYMIKIMDRQILIKFAKAARETFEKKYDNNLIKEKLYRVIESL